MQMADTTVTKLNAKRQPLTPAERQRLCRQRKREAAKVSGSTVEPETVTDQIRPNAELVTVPAEPVTEMVSSRSHSRPSVASVALTAAAAAVALAVVGITMNGWFARSLGSSDVAGWLFLAVGVAADCAALVLPSSAAAAWASSRRGVSVAGWLAFLVTFAFAVTAGIGFASVNITDTTQARAARVTPAIVTAKAALADAVTSRDRECKGGVGKYCRAREDAVASLVRRLDETQAAVASQADPQTEAARKLVAWISYGKLSPSADDFGMVRLLLLALLPQLGGVPLMVGRK
jgi:hypothetical protein